MPYHQSKSDYASAILAMLLIDFVEVARIEQLDTYLYYFVTELKQKTWSGVSSSDFSALLFFAKTCMLSWSVIS